ncbi:unnamed protein product [Tetraodon nigroviridis]|uniref:(spotted green pufferfish) hypothetical protein n=1 Tax=Tetraodon nigroviridis TaxID=99883 RepID=Q4SEK0_TETNG|nr:unnamed protein product [Tetraodon nigroviridis]
MELLLSIRPRPAGVVHSIRAEPGWLRASRSSRCLFVGCSFAMIQCLEADGITSIPTLSPQESENVTEIYIENQGGLENITEMDLLNYRELKNLTITSCKLKLISANAFQQNLKLQYV